MLFWALLLSEKRKDELKQPAGRVRPMREVPMIPRADRKHAQPVERDADCDRLPCNARPDRRGATEMDQYKWKSGRVDDVVMLVIDVDVADMLIILGSSFPSNDIAQVRHSASIAFASLKRTPLLAGQTAGFLARGFASTSVVKALAMFAALMRSADFPRQICRFGGRDDFEGNLLPFVEGGSCLHVRRALI